MNGLEVCRRLRAGSPVPIIMLTALGNELDRVVGLEVGADDYIPKPFSLRELLARVRSVLRRVELDHKAQNPNLLQVDGLQIDASSRRGFKNGTEIQLTTREFDLLFKLMSHAGQAVSREELIATVWGRDWSGDVRTLEVHVRWLRVKIEDDPTIPRFIQTVRGYGYRFIGCDEPE
jgi:DNA-binding response OmpR family regulator